MSLLDKGAIKQLDPLSPGGVSFHLLSCRKERWQTPPYPRLEGTQQVPEGLEVSHTQHCRDSAYCCQRGVVYFNRPEGCVLSCPHSITPQTIPEVFLSRATGDSPLTSTSFSSFGMGRCLRCVLYMRLSGKLMAAATVVPLGLLSLRPLQRWLNSFHLDAK